VLLTKFKFATGVNKLIGANLKVFIKDHNYTRYKYKRAETSRDSVYYISKFKKRKFVITYTFLKLNKELFFNCDFFKITNLSFLKKNIAFKKKQRMLRTFLNKTLALNKVTLSTNYANLAKLKNFNYKKLNKFESHSVKAFSYFKNFNVRSLFLKNRRAKKSNAVTRNKLSNRNSIYFKKKFLKSLIFSRSMFKFVFNTKLNKKKNVARLVSGSAHSTFFNRLTKLEFTLFNLLLRCRIVFTIKDAQSIIKSNYIYVNSKIMNDPFKQLSVYDRIQIAIGKNYFFFRSFFYSRVKMDIAKLKNKLWRKRSGSFNLFRKRSKR
jgi:ribosomal protein S4